MKTHLIAAAIGLMLGVGSTLGVIRALPDPVIKVEPQVSCPEFKCPEGNNIDFEKVKNFKGTLKIDQHYHITANGDSLLRETLIKDFEAKLAQLKLARCK